MKKKLALLTTFLVSTALAITAIIFAEQNFNFDQVTGTTFVLDTNGVDVKKEAMVNNKNGAKVNTTFFDTTLDENGIFIEAGNYVIWSNDIDSPIRGIESVSIYTDLASSYSINPYIDVAIYTSYNYLNFEDIQFGQYSDLVTKGMYNYYYTFLGDGNFNCDIEEENARYFLAVICSKIDVHITDVAINSICGKEPTGSEDIGVFNQYRQSESDILPNDFPFIGNGSYESNTNSGDAVEFFISGLKGNVSYFRYSLVEYGYSLVDVSEDVYNIYTYQKYNPAHTSEDDQYFTLRITEGDEYDDFVFNEEVKYYLDPEVAIVPNYKNNSWPSANIGNYLNNAGYQAIASDPCIALNGINYGYDNGFAYADFVNPEDEILEPILDGFKNYKTRFEDIGFILTYESDIDPDKELYATINYELYAPKFDYRLYFIYQVTKNAFTGNIICRISFEFRKYNSMDITEFNTKLVTKELPTFATTGSMVFADDNPYYGSPIKASDLYAYAEVLTKNGITVDRVNKNELISNKIRFVKYKNSLTYKITF